MSNITFVVPKLTENKAWLDYRGQYPGGHGWRYDRALSTIKYAANHHSVTNPSFNAKKDVDSLWSIHKGNGWGGIGYNFVITSEEVNGKDGLRYAKVAYVGDIGSVRAHTPNVKGAFKLRSGYGNEDIVAACMIGMLHQKNPTEAQIRSAYWLYRELITQEGSRLPNLKGSISEKLKGHKDFDPTACPGDWAWQKDKIVKYKDPPKIEHKEETRVATIQYAKVTLEDPELPVGETRVESGADGEKHVTWRVTYTNGVETRREIIREVIIRNPKDEVTHVGTYVEPPTPEPEPPVEPQPPIPPVNDVITRIIEAIVNFIKSFFSKK